MPSAEKYVLLTGSDLGDRHMNLAKAFELIDLAFGGVLSSSDIMESEPWGFESSTRFLNQAILIRSTLGPVQVLDELQKIERQIGRTPKTEQWSSRIIDIDMLCAESQLFHSDRLTLPHRYLQEREFALVPLCQLAGEWLHPLFKKNYITLLEELHLQQSSPISPAIR